MTLFAGICIVLGVVLVAHLAVTLTVPHLAVPWRAAVLLYLYGFTTSLGVPIPIEPALLAGALTIGAIPTIVITVAAKVTAAWGVFFIGDEMGHRIREKAARKPWFARLLAASESFAQRFGLFAVALFLATPGLPDAIALYTFGSLHMRLWKYLLGVAIGGSVLYTALLFGLMHFLGLG
jgi:uncharacterized membrane protein YdjX (TVP38/TMEM64 family)